MQREKPVFEVIPNCLSVFPVQVESIQASAHAKNQMREPLRNAHCASHNPTPRRHDSPPNVKGPFIDRSSAVWNF
jgi:hypothetical protein